MLVVLVSLVLLAGCAHRQAPPAVSAIAATTQPARIIRISADPNNLPFTNDKLEGFENKIAQLVADDLGATIEYHWRAQRRGFFRNTLKENECDLVLGVPNHFERALTTSPYYRSTYCFVTRTDRHLGITSLDDIRLRELKIGVQLAGDDGAVTPPGYALASRGIVQNIVGFTLFGDYREPNPPARIIDAVAKGEIDVAVVWGPLAGYFAKRQSVPLDVVPVSNADRDSLTGLPFAFEISMGCRKPAKALRDELNGVLERHRADIDKVLDDYGIPRLAIVNAPAPTHDDDDDDDKPKVDGALEGCEECK